MAIFGISCGFHDAAISVVEEDKILFAAHAERYSRVKGDKLLNQELVNAALDHGGKPEAVIFHEKPWLKRLRRWAYGQGNGFNAKDHIKQFFRGHRIYTMGHHESHAAAGWYTSDYESAAVVVIDAIGEWDTISVWDASIWKGMEKVWSAQYPDSLGLLYSAFTKRCGFKPNEEEYIMMGASAFGTPSLVDEIRKDFIESADAPDFKLKRNVHRGIGDWMPDAKVEDIAASIQFILEEYLHDLMEWVRAKTGRKRLVYMGGVALNCVANAKLFDVFDDVWIMPNPGDAGSSLGAALAWQGAPVAWRGPYLGKDIGEGFSVKDAVTGLVSGKVVALAHGRAEFGPRALGNRSLLVDPRYRSSKTTVNRIKQREQFRPFAASILAEHAHDHFLMPANANSAYMQYAWRAKHPQAVPAICHVDGTSRIQTVTREQNPSFHALLEAWYQETGCPMLLNTSLNVKGEPLVNSWADVMKFGRSIVEVAQ